MARLSPEAIEDRVRRRLAELAPPGTPYTPELAREIRVAVQDELTAVLRESGIANPAVDPLVLAIIGAMRVRFK